MQRNDISHSDQCRTSVTVWVSGVRAAGGAARKVTAGGVEWCIAGNKQVVDQMEEWLRG